MALLPFLFSPQTSDGQLQAHSRTWPQGRYFWGISRPRLCPTTHHPRLLMSSSMLASAPHPGSLLSYQPVLPGAASLQPQPVPSPCLESQLGVAHPAKAIALRSSSRRRGKSCPWEGTMPDHHTCQAAQLVSSQRKATMLPLRTHFPPTRPDPASLLVFLLLCLERACLCQMDAKQLRTLCLSSLERKRLRLLYSLQLPEEEKWRGVC